MVPDVRYDTAIRLCARVNLSWCGALIWIEGRKERRKERRKGGRQERREGDYI